MKQEHSILAVFIGIIIVSGAIIYLSQGSRPDLTVETNAPEDQGPSPGPDPTKIGEHIEHLKEQLRSDPNNYNVLVDLGNSHYDLNEPALAIEYYERALQIRPNDAGVLVDLGAMYRQNGDADKAIELFNKAIQIDPRLPQAYFNLGMVFQVEKGDSVSAAKAWKKYLELDPNSQMKGFLQERIKAVLGI
jgi:tetratricopeptide (TPR) repeat protein